MRNLFLPTLLVVACGVLAPATLVAQSNPEARFEQLRAERFQAVAAVVIEPTAPPPALLVPETPEELFAPHWRTRLSESDWQLLQETFRAEGVPVELLAVGWVESRFNPRALSPKGARGVWQFMPETARRYGLQVNDRRDDRTDFALSTRAAARHLSDLYRQFGDWPLALAAYNAGADRVEAAIARARTRDFRLIRPWLPAETQDYVPAVLHSSESSPRVRLD
jgi:soluble lytic murein transglycosylase-like protein